MRHRLFTDQPLVAGKAIAIAGEEFHHAARVARVREKEEVELFDGRGSAARGEVTSVDTETITIQVHAAIPSREPSLQLTLAVAIIQLDKFELVLQKGTELGVSRFIPLVTERVEVRPERYHGKAERWQKIIFEAVKQSGRSLIAPIDAPAPFDDVIRGEGVRLLFDADAEAGSVPQPLRSATLLIGPEGGWSEDEIARAIAAGCIIYRLGPRRLRAETAAIIAAGIIAARYGDI